LRGIWLGNVDCGGIELIDLLAGYRKTGVAVQQKSASGRVRPLAETNDYW